ncbi:MAG: hypothetical protein SNJ57_15800 [Cyanobacteriota bacterium]
MLLAVAERMVYGGWGVAAIASGIVVVAGVALTGGVVVTGFAVGAALGLIAPRQ